MTIDSHQHFWNYDPVEYDWIRDDMANIRRDFGPSDLRAALDRADIDGAITVQARQTLDETRWLLQLARENRFIRGVVGWVPLCEPTLGAALAEFEREETLRGVRHLVQGEPDGFMERGDFNVGIRALKETELIYDIVVRQHQLPEAIRFVDRHPNQSFVLDHIAKPLIQSGEIEPWATNIRELARRENVACKVSGMVTEVGAEWTSAHLRPYFDVVLEAFWPNRLMFGSDWPVCLARTDYSTWAQTVREWTSDLSDDEHAAIWGQTAAQIYGL